MERWKRISRWLNSTEYAQQVCLELGWCFDRNVGMIAQCIRSLAYKDGLTHHGGFLAMMTAIEDAKKKEIEIDRWFFEDGKYNRLLAAPERRGRKLPAEKSKKKSVEAGSLRDGA